MPRGRLEIYDVIGPSWYGMIGAQDVARALDEMGDVDGIDLHLNTPGGVITEGIAIYNLLKDHEAPVTAHIDGLAASMGSIVMLAGDEIRIAENALVMIHEPSGLGWGTAQEMRDLAELLDKLRNDVLIPTYEARTGNDRKQLAKWMKDETWFSSAEAVEHGFADVVAKNKAKASNVAPEMMAWRKAPAGVTELVTITGGKHLAAELRTAAGELEGEALVHALAAAGVDQAAYEALAAGNGACPTLELLRNLAAALNWRPDRLAAAARADGCPVSRGGAGGKAGSGRGARKKTSKSQSADGACRCDGGSEPKSFPKLRMAERRLDLLALEG